MLPIVKLPFENNGFLTYPLFNGQVAVGINMVPQLFGEQFSEQIQKQLLDKGRFFEAREFFLQNMPISKTNIQVPLGAHKKRKAAIPAELTITVYFFSCPPKGFVVLLPTFGLETFCEKAEQIEQAALELVQLEFSRKKTAESVVRTIETAWFGSPEIHNINFSFAHPTLLDQMQGEEKGVKQRLLKQVAHKHVASAVRQLYGMDAALESAVAILQNSYNRNLLLVGKSGVGKSALVAELVRTAPSKGLQIEVWETTASMLIKSLTQEVGWRENLHRLCKEISQGGEILHVAHLLDLFEVGQYEGNSVSMADFLYDYLSRGEIGMIAEATEEELAVIESRNARFAHAFHVLRLEEPTGSVPEIVLKKVGGLADQRGVGFAPKAAEEILRLQRRYLPYSGFPGKSIRFLEHLLIDMAEGEQLDRAKVMRAFCEETGMPMFMVDPETPFDTARTRDFFGSRVYGQPEAVKVLVDVLATVKAGLVRNGKPIASLFFVGPTGVGKTELAKVLAELVFGHSKRLLRFDMSEYADPLAVMRFTTGLGNASGEGQLAAAVRQDPFSVLLFDEIEKAHPLFFDHLLQILDEGRLTDSKGQLVNFCSSIIIMTSNVGAKQLDQSPIGLGPSKDNRDMAAVFEKAAQDFFRPELFNRIERIVPFGPLDENTIGHVLERELRLLHSRVGIRDRDLRLTIEAPVLQMLSRAGYHPRYGAREMQRSLQDLIVGPLSKKLNEHAFDESLETVVGMGEKGHITITTRSDTEKNMHKLLESYKKVGQADRSGELRNSLRSVLEGHSYLYLLSNIRQMEQLSHEDKGIYYSPEFNDQCRSVAQRFAALDKEIVETEENLILHLMNILPYDPAWEERLKTWALDCRSAKLDLLNLVGTDRSDCRIDIVSAEPSRQVELYRKLLEKLGQVGATLESWWHSPAVQKMQGNSGPSTGWLICEENWESPQWAPPLEDPQATLMGARLLLRGKPRPYLFFVGETGLHKWISSDNHTELCHVRVTELDDFVNDFPMGTPSHKQFFRSTAQLRRTYEPARMTDSLFRFQRSQVQEDNFAELLFPMLENAYQALIELELQ
jgi:ATP-dependent Clp protease ATP-binding subunit ClpA